MSITLVVAFAALALASLAVGKLLWLLMGPLQTIVRLGEEIYVTSPDASEPGRLNATKVRLYREEQLSAEPPATGAPPRKDAN